MPPLTDSPPSAVPARQTKFRRLPGRVPQLTLRFARRRSALWLGEEELIQVDTVLWREKTRRFAYADIQALLLRETPRGLYYSVAAGGLAALCGLLAWGMESAGARGFLAGVALFFAGLLIYNAARGGTCRCVLQTALGPMPLPSLARRRPARRALRLITEQVEEKQQAEGGR